MSYPATPHDTRIIWNPSGHCPARMDHPQIWRRMARQLSSQLIPGNKQDEMELRFFEVTEVDPGFGICVRTNAQDPEHFVVCDDRASNSFRTGDCFGLRYTPCSIEIWPPANDP